MFATRSSRTGDRMVVEDHGEDVDAVTAVITALAGARDTREAVVAALTVVKDAFGYVYGSHWVIDHTDGDCCTSR